MQTDQDYVALLAGQLANQAEASPALARDLDQFEIADDAPARIVHISTWARWINSGDWHSYTGIRAVNAMTRSWPASLGVQDHHNRRGRSDSLEFAA